MDVKAQDLMGNIHNAETGIVYRARGVDYEFSMYERNRTHDGGSLVITAYNSKDEVIWTACDSYFDHDRVIDVVRSCSVNRD